MEPVTSPSDWRNWLSCLTCCEEDDQAADELQAYMEKLIAEVAALKVDNEWQIKQNIKMFKALEEISKADGTPEAPKHVSRSALIQAAINGMVEAV